MLLVQAKDGEDPELQGTAHLYQIFRGVLIGFVIYALAPVVSSIFSIPQAEWAFRLVAIVPVLNGFIHLDWKRMQRKLNYKLTFFIEVFPQLVVTLIALPMITWYKSYVGVLWLILIQAVVALLISQLFAQRVYRINFNRAFALRIIIFGWPLLLNGLLMFLAIKGDYLIIGEAYSMATLGVYSVSFSLILTLVVMLAKMCISLLLPILSKLQDDGYKFQQMYIPIVRILALVSGVFAVPFIVSGGSLIVLIFGEQYSSASLFAPWLGVLLAIRMFRFAPTVASLAYGDTKNLMIANLYRLVGVALAVVVAYLKMPFLFIIIAGIIGETLAFLALILRLKRKQHVKIAYSFAPAAMMLLLFVFYGIRNLVLGVPIGLLNNAIIYLVFGGLFITCGVGVFKQFKYELNKSSECN